MSIFNRYYTSWRSSWIGDIRPLCFTLLACSILTQAKRFMNFFNTARIEKILKKILLKNLTNVKTQNSPLIHVLQSDRNHDSGRIFQSVQWHYIPIPGHWSILMSEGGRISKLLLISSCPLPTFSTSHFGSSKLSRILFCFAWFFGSSQLQFWRQVLNFPLKIRVEFLVVSKHKNIIISFFA